MKKRTQEPSGLEGRITPCAPPSTCDNKARRGVTLLASVAPFLLLLGQVTSLPAQSYSIDWWSISAGAGTSTGVAYQVSGTIGQPDAGLAISGGRYSVTGGFWSLIFVVPTAGLPNLIISHAGNSVTVSWPNTGSYTLQQNNNLAEANWVASGYLINFSNGTNSITITLPTGNLFFRLKP